MAKGMSNAEIADKLVTSIAKVKFYMHYVMRKMGASSQTNVVSFTWKHNLVQ
jgi:DNA-binding NarL/FixJ family response regulator